jgi:limonene-1,2-epoxide hydrolase
MKKSQPVKVILHGECMVFRTPQLPSGLKPVSKQKISPDRRFVVVAPSETTGNHHVVDVLDGVDFYEDDGGTLFMQNSVPTQIRCVLAERHDAIILEPNTWEFGTQQEYDHISEELQKVRD